MNREQLLPIFAFVFVIMTVIIDRKRKFYEKKIIMCNACYYYDAWRHRLRFRKETR